MDLNAVPTSNRATGNDLGQALESLSIRQPKAPALHVSGRNSLTYEDLGAQVRYVRDRLGGWGIARGDVVAAVIPSRPEMAVACATMSTSSTFAPLSPALTVETAINVPELTESLAKRFVPRFHARPRR